MRISRLTLLLMLTVALTASAQLGPGGFGGGFAGHGGFGGFRPGAPLPPIAPPIAPPGRTVVVGGPVCCPNGIHPGFRPGFGPGFNTVFLGGTYYPYEYAQPAIEPVVNVAPPPIVVVASPEAAQPPTAPSTAKAQIIEVSGPENVRDRPQQAAIFVLQSGERIEASRFLLTADFLQVSVGRNLRRVPFEAIDVPATLAANQQRGVQLKIPSDPNEVSLNF